MLNITLSTTEENLPPVERDIIGALRFLHLRCDGAKTKDFAGFNGFDSRFAEDLVAQLDAGERLTPNQLSSLASMIRKYSTQLFNAGGITLPSIKDITLYISTREREYTTQTGKPVLPSQTTVKYKNGQLLIYIPYKFKDHGDLLREELFTRYKKNEKGFSGYMKWLNTPEKEYQVPATEEILSLIVENKYFPAAILDKNASAILQKKEQRIANDLKVKEEIDNTRKKVYLEIMKQVGLHGKENPMVAPGIHLYRHQVQAARFIVWKSTEKMGTLIADEMGLGKTFEAIIAVKALFLYYGWEIIVVTTKSMKAQWARDVEKFSMNARIFTWDTIPEAGTITTPFTLVADEAHYGKNEKTIRSKAMQALALHPLCKTFVPMTGTPLDNSRPVEAYPLLVACKNPRVYDENPVEMKKKKKWYEKTFCGATLETVGGRRVYDQELDRYVIKGGHTIKNVKGATNLTLWHNLFVYTYGKKNNDSTACILARRKRDELTELPPLTIMQREAEIESADLKLFAKRVENSILSFEKNLVTSLEKFIEKYKEEKGTSPSQDEIEEKQDQIRGAQKVVMYQAYAMAGALAKMSWTLKQIHELLENNEKIVVFSTFKEVVFAMEKAINKEYGEGCAVALEGSKSDKERDQMVKDFQNPDSNVRVLLGTRAGGEGITLTEAAYMFIMDRAVWTPGRIKQWMGRIDRIGQKRYCTCIWVQIPEYVTGVDVTIDNTIQTKARGTNKALYNEDEGIEMYNKLEGREEEFVRKAFSDIQKLKIA